MDILLAVLCLLLLCITWLGGRWWQYDLGDYITNGVRFLFDSLFSAIPLIVAHRRQAARPRAVQLASRLRAVFARFSP